MRFYTSIFTILILIASACSPFNDLDPPAFMDEDNVDQIRLPSDSRSISTEWEYAGSTEINWSNYSNIDSIVFIANMRSETTEDQCIAELYDYSNNRSVPSTEVSSVVRYFYHSVRSRNISLSIDPNSASKYGVRFRSTKNGHFVALGEGSQILIYHH